MRQSRIDSLETPGVCLDCSPPGAGKSYADCEAASQVKASLTVTPSHKNCQEVVTMFRQMGVDRAEAYPALTKKTCQNYDAAVLAIEIGLSPSGSVCLICPHRDDCEYQAQMEAADAALHRVATHTRAEFSFEKLAENRPYIAIHEDAVNLLRPTEETAAGLEKVAAVARKAKDDAGSEAEFAARNLRKRDEQTLRSFQQFYFRLEEIAYWLTDQFRQSSATSALTMPPAAGKPLSLDLRLWKAAHAIQMFPSQAPMRICKGICAGDVAELVIRVDEVLTAGGLPAVHKTIMAVWHTEIPGDATTWFSDSTADPAVIETLIGRPILNCTPPGQLERKTRVVQIPRDLKISSSPKTALSVLRGVLGHFPDARRVGVIGHSRHLPAIRGTATKDNLEDSARCRIVKAEHFRGGESRGSNAWLDLCDLLIVLGTPRVPPAAVRSYLIRIGKVDAAVRRTGKDGEISFGPTTWTGTTEAGEPVTVEGLTYDDPAWRQAHQALVVSELRQAIGRGREFSDSGVNVVVVTNENLGLPLLEMDTLKVAQSEAEILRAVFELSLPNPKGLGNLPYRYQTLKEYLLDFGSDKPSSPSFVDCKAIVAGELQPPAYRSWRRQRHAITKVASRVHHVRLVLMGRLAGLEL